MALARAQHDIGEAAGIGGRALCWHAVHAPAAGIALDRVHGPVPATHAGSPAVASTTAVSDCTAAAAATSVVVPVGVVNAGGKHGTPQWAQAAPSRKWMQGWRAPGTVPSAQQEWGAAHPSTCHRDDASANTWGSQSLSSNSGSSGRGFQRCEGRRASVGRVSFRTGHNSAAGKSWSSLLPTARQTLAPLPSEATCGPEPAEAAEDSGDEGAEQHGEMGIGHSAARMERGSKRARESSGRRPSATQQRRQGEYHSPRSSCDGGHGGAAGRGSDDGGGSGSGAGSDGNEGSESPHSSHTLAWLGPGDSTPPAAVDTHGGVQAAGMTTLTVPDQSPPPTVATADLHRTGAALSFRGGGRQFTRPHVLSVVTGSAMPRVTVAIWDDVVDRHVADDVARGSDKEDEAPWSPNYARLKRTATCSKRCASRVKRVVKRTWGGLLPGNMESRAMYVQPRRVARDSLRRCGPDLLHPVLPPQLRAIQVGPGVAVTDAPSGAIISRWADSGQVDVRAGISCGVPL